MAIAAWLVTGSPDSPSRTLGLALFVLQLALNLAWSWIFFRKHAIGPAALEVAVLWCAIGATTLVFSRVSPTVCMADGAVLGLGHLRLHSECSHLAPEPQRDLN